MFSSAQVRSWVAWRENLSDLLTKRERERHLIVWYAFWLMILDVHAKAKTWHLQQRSFLGTFFLIINILFSANRNVIYSVLSVNLHTQELELFFKLLVINVFCSLFYWQVADKMFFTFGFSFFLLLLCCCFLTLRCFRVIKVQKTTLMKKADYYFKMQRCTMVFSIFLVKCPIHNWFTKII